MKRKVNGMTTFLAKMKTHNQENKKKPIEEEEPPNKQTKVTQEKQLKWIINDDEAKVSFVERFLEKKEADRLFQDLRQNVDWKQEKIKIMNTELYPSRMTASYGEPGLTYSYSGVQKTATDWIEPLSELRDLVENETGIRYNFALLNLYR
jgi:hypothetical protein